MHAKCRDIRVGHLPLLQAVLVHGASMVRPRVLETGLDRPEEPSPIIQTYLLPVSHGKCRRFCCECMLIVGFVLPLLGPLLGFCVFVPYFDLQFGENSIVQPNTPCYGPTPAVCGGSFSFDYYFWNITNSEEARTGSHCGMQVSILHAQLYDKYLRACSGYPAMLHPAFRRSAHTALW